MVTAATNVQIIHQTYAAIGSADMPGVLQRMSREIIWRVPEMVEVPFAGEWRGHQGVEEFFTRVAKAQEVVAFQHHQFVAQEQTVVVLGHFVMRVRATGRLSRSDWAHVWTLSEGLIVRFQEYVDTAAVRAAHAST